MIDEDYVHFSDVILLLVICIFHFEFWFTFCFLMSQTLLLYILYFLSKNTLIYLNLVRKLVRTRYRYKTNLNWRIYFLQSQSFLFNNKELLQTGRVTRKYAGIVQGSAITKHG